MISNFTQLSTHHIKQLALTLKTNKYTLWHLTNTLTNKIQSSGNLHFTKIYVNE